MAQVQLLTNSRMKTFRRCRRLHYFSYELLRRPLRTAEALGFGKMFHSGLELWWRAFQEATALDQPSPGELALEVALGGIAGEFLRVSEEAELDPYDFARAEELMRGYHYRWLAAMEDYEVLGVEEQFVIPLWNPKTVRKSTLFSIGGKLDARIRERSSQRVLVVEHKTSSADIMPGSDYWKLLQMDSQISTYLDGSAYLGEYPASGCLYDVARKPAIRPYAATPEESLKYTKGKGCKVCGGSAGGKTGVVQGSGQSDVGLGPCSDCDGTGWKEAPRLHAGQRLEPETPDQYRLRVREAIAADPNGFYQRGEVVRLAHDLDEHRYDTWETAHELRERQLAGRTLSVNAWPRNPGACNQWGRLCEYWAVCTGAADIHDDLWFRTAGQTHEELAGESAQ